jgi:hypothetical protein
MTTNDTHVWVQRLLDEFGHVRTDLNNLRTDLTELRTDLTTDLTKHVQCMDACLQSSSMIDTPATTIYRNTGDGDIGNSRLGAIEARLEGIEYRLHKAGL